MYLNKNTFAFLKGIKIQNSILDCKYMYLQYCPSLDTGHLLILNMVVFIKVMCVQIFTIVIVIIKKKHCIMKRVCRTVI